MNLLHTLPTRRDEGWRWSDLRAALRGVALPEGSLVGGGVDPHAIVRLAGGAGSIKVGPGESRALVARLGHTGPLCAAAVEIDVAEGGALTRVVLQGQTAGVVADLVRVRLSAGSRFRQFILSEGGQFARIETHVDILGAGVEVELNGVYLAGAARHADLTSVVRHAQPGSRTTQLIKGAARKGGRGVFQGRIVVERDAQHTDARQNHHALLLEEGAEVDAKPELEIFADDVQCAHGNTVGGLSVDQLFYLRSRGVPEAEGRALLTEAFLGEAVSNWLSEEMREEVFLRIRDWLGRQP